MKELEAILRLNESYRFANKHADLTDNHGDQTLAVNVEALRMAIDALKNYEDYKRLKSHDSARKPEVHRRFYSCPTCGANLTYYLDGGARIELDYCGNCGQAIDWTEVEG